MKQLRKARWNFAAAIVYLALELLGVALGCIFVISAFFNEYMAVFLMSVLILAIAWTQSQIEVRRYR